MTVYVITLTEYTNQVSSLYLKNSRRYHGKGGDGMVILLDLAVRPRYSFLGFFKVRSSGLVEEGERESADVQSYSIHIAIHYCLRACLK